MSSLEGDLIMKNPLVESLEEAIAGNAAEEVPLSPYFGEASQVVKRYTACGVCGAHLHFSHITDFSRNVTQETARCPECGQHARRVMHRLQ